MDICYNYTVAVRLFSRPEIELTLWRYDKLPRILGRDKKEGHIKHLYCPQCQAIQKFKELSGRQILEIASYAHNDI